MPATFDRWQVPGSQQESTAAAAADRPASQALLDTQGRTVRDYVRNGGFAVAVLAVLVAVFAIWAGGWTTPVTVAGGTGVLLGFAAMFVVMAAPGALRASGHFRLAPWGFVAFGVLVVAAGAAFTQLPRTHIGDVPGLGLLAVALVGCWLSTRPGKARSQPDPTSSGSRDPDDAAAWFARLEALLIGRFDVPAERAAALAAETRDLVTAAGATPRQEFPSLARYAWELAEREPVRQGPWWRTPAARLIAQACLPLMWLPVVVDSFLDGDFWFGAVGVIIVSGLGWTAFRRLQTLRKDRRAG